MTLVLALGFATGRDMSVPIAAGVALLIVGAVCAVSARRNTRKDRT